MAPEGQPHLIDDPNGGPGLWLFSGVKQHRTGLAPQWPYLLVSLPGL